MKKGTSTVYKVLANEGEGFDWFRFLSAVHCEGRRAEANFFEMDFSEL